MKLDREDIEEFKRIYREEFGEELSDAEAERRARQLLTFYEIIAGILERRRTNNEPATATSLRPLTSPSPPVQ